MEEAEQQEKIRQAIMRCRELLNLLQGSTAGGERAYEALFAGLSAEQLALPEKQRQGEAARLALADLEPLRALVLRLRFDMHNLERGFEELYDNIAPDA